jgi:hypothetical protein
MGHISAGPRPDPMFVLCEARTGSTLLRFLVDAHPDVACPSETNLPALCHELVTLWSIMTGHPAPSQRVPGQLPVLPDDVLDGMRASIDLMMSAHLERVGKTWFCDKSLGSAMHAKLLLQLYPDTKFVCLYRHPMDVIASGLEACPWGLVGYGFDPYIAATPGNSCRLPAVWDHPEGFSATSMGPPGCQLWDHPACHAGDLDHWRYGYLKSIDLGVRGWRSGRLP